MDISTEKFFSNMRIDVKKGKKRRNDIKATQLQLTECIEHLLKLTTETLDPINQRTALDHYDDLSNHIDKIKILEQKLIKSNTSEDIARYTPEKLELFTKWLEENGATCDGCSIAEFPGYGLGLKADTDIPFSKQIITVPRKLILTLEDADLSLKKYILKDHLMKHMPNVALAILLLMEKFKYPSEYQPYIDVLPKSYSTILYFSKEEIHELKGSPTLFMAIKQIRNTARQYCYFRSLFNAQDDHVCRTLRQRFTYEEYCWAVSTVMTRQNLIPSTTNPNVKISALIPLWDLCNHEDGTFSTDYDTETQQSRCLAYRDFKKGEQLFIYYGARTNADFFIHNGFVPTENKSNAFSIKLGISKSDPLLKKRCQLAEKLNLVNIQEYKVFNRDKPLDLKLVAFIRLFSLDEGQLDMWIKSPKFEELQYLKCDLDEPVKKKSWEFLQTRLKLILATYPTTLDEDKKLLEENKLSANSLLAVKMRASEKDLIYKTIEWLDQQIQKSSKE